MKRLIIAALFLTSCGHSNKIAVKFSKYGPAHYMKYTEVNGNYYVNGRLVKLIEGTCIYAKTK